MAKRTGLAVLLLMVAPAVVGCSGTGDARELGRAQPTARTVLDPDREKGRTPRVMTGNQRKGSDGWRMTRPAAEREVEAYTSRVSGLSGSRVGVMVSTDARSFLAQAWRMGSYRGGTGRLVWSSHARGHRQAEPSFAPYETRTVVARWKPSVSVDTAGWEPGFYLFKITTDTGWQTHAPYVVSSPSAAGTVALVAPFATYQAYNRWGGYSLYEAPAGDRRSWVVSFDRPWDVLGEANNFRRAALPIIVRAEALGVPLSYFANLDLDQRSDALDGARGYVSMGHDEYWTPAMREQVEAARDSGTNLAFLGANTMYWRVRLEGRSMVGYRGDAWQDPARGDRPGEATARFRDAPKARPEHDLVGMQYECFPVDADYRVVTPAWWGFRGTGVRQGQVFAGLIGPESDRVYPDRATPRPLQVLSHTTFSCGGVTTSSQSVYYTTRSGAGVFAAGTLRWGCAIIDMCEHPLGRATSQFVRIVTDNVVRSFARGPVGERWPARDNVGEFDLPLHNTVPAS
jgi:hypothetical protein